MMSILCMTLMTTNNMRRVMTFMHMHNDLLMVSSTKMKLLGIRVRLCLLQGGGGGLHLQTVP